MLAHKGSKGYLSKEQRGSVLVWIQQKPQRPLSEVIDYIEQQYQVLYRCLGSYCALLKASAMSWHKEEKMGLRLG